MPRTLAGIFVPSRPMVVTRPPHAERDPFESSQELAVAADRHSSSFPEKLARTDPGRSLELSPPKKYQQACLAVLRKSRNGHTYFLSSGKKDSAKSSFVRCCFYASSLDPTAFKRPSGVRRINVATRNHLERRVRKPFTVL
mmetsp:Transcript_1696/g.3604  ORF Transcript_1696/g.3604 Transcript_1696/m.3604 type:complete len:141 (-) Transcript_1696:645-1067(-)